MKIVDTPYVERATILSKFIQTLSPHLDIEKGPWLVGGAVLRDHLGDEVNPSDYDIAFATDRQRNQFRKMILAGGLSKTPLPLWKRILGHTHPEARSTSPYGSRNYVITDQYDFLHTVSLIERSFKSVDNFIVQVDFTVCAMATDGRIVRSLDGTFPDVASRALRLTPKAHGIFEPRAAKYMDRGFLPTAEFIADLPHKLTALQFY